MPLGVPFLFLVECQAAELPVEVEWSLVAAKVLLVFPPVGLFPLKVDVPSQELAGI
jgi:hypothetical protein